MRKRHFATVALALCIARTPAGGVITNDPAHSARLGAALPLGPVSAGASVRIESRRGTVRGSRTSAHRLAGVNLATGRLVPGLKVTLNIENLLDPRYAPPGGFRHVQDAIPQFGRVLSLELSLLP